MRDIIFRAKSLEDNEWIEGYLHKKRNPFKENFYIDALRIGRIGEYNTINCVTEEVDVETICQYTGLKDKNDKRIFEHDLIRSKYGNTILIKWTNTGFYAYRKVGEYFNKVTNWKNVIEGEIIGNLYDNPELLEYEDDKTIY